MAATMNGGDSIKSANTAPAPSKQQLKNAAPSAKTLDGARKQAPSPVDGQTKKPQNAWSKGAPAIGNRTPSTVNGSQKPPPPAPAVSQPKSTVDSSADKHAHDRAIFLFSQFVGKDATLTLKSGEQFTGVFSGGAFDASKPQYLLKMVRRIRLPSSQQTNGDIQLPHEYIGEGEEHAMSFDIQDAELNAQDVTTTTASALQPNGTAGSFMTDAQISARAYRERELQRWEPGPDTEVDLSLEAAGTSSGTDWDQFAANERMYGVSSSYDEDIYTTTIDRNNPEYKRQVAKAERIAREIENSAPANAHVAEERRRDGQRGDDAGDEEEKYSGVARESSALPKRAAGAYVPPSQRPITGSPSVHGAPFDPAIISSQLKAAPAPAAAAKPAQEQAKPTEKATPAAAEASKVVLAAPTASIEPPKKKENNTTEDRVRDTADAFKQFANNEKLRIRAAQEQKRVTQRQEKNVKLNDLKKFAENFKLKSRVPDDLVPILAKDREKQLEIQKKADQAAKEEEIRAKDRDSEKASSVTASPAPSSSVSQAAPAPNADQRLPFNQQNRPRLGQQARPQIPPGQSPGRMPLTQRIHNNNFPYNNRPQPLPENLRIPSGPPPSLGTDMPMSPNSATRLNVNAKSFEFRPGASAFTPTGTSPSPARTEKTEEVVSFFGKNKKKEIKASVSSDPVKRMAESDYPEHLKAAVSKNGGVPQVFSTAPTWQYHKSHENTSHTAAFPKAQAPSSGPSPMHTPNPGQMPHSHQLPAHMQGTPSMPVPNQRQPFYGQPQHGHAPSFDPRLQQQFGPNGSVQNSPRVQQVPVAPFNGQMPPMQMQQFPGQPMPQYGMSPSMQYRQMAPQGGPMMMPGGPQPQMMPMRPGFGAPQFNPQMAGGHMMVQNPSQGYQNGPMPQNYGGSPMPPHAQPHMPHMQQHGSFSGSPRPHMMSHQGSHQGFQPGMPMQPHFAPSPGQYPHHMQHRAMSSGYPQMTPRQQAAVPNHPSPGMGVGQGDEGK